jgi:hypothetical protein
LPGKAVPTRPVYFAKPMKTHLKDSFEFKRMIDSLDRLDPRAKISIYDA